MLTLQGEGSFLRVEMPSDPVTLETYHKYFNNEPFFSHRRVSVKNDNTPNLLAGSVSGIEKLALDVTPTPSANLNLPGDRRPLSAKASSDSIDEYLKNWKKDDTSSPTKIENFTNNNDCNTTR